MTILVPKFLVFFKIVYPLSAILRLKRKRKKFRYPLSSRGRGVRPISIVTQKLLTENLKISITLYKGPADKIIIKIRFSVMAILSGMARLQPPISENGVHQEQNGGCSEDQNGGGKTVNGKRRSALAAATVDCSPSPPSSKKRKNSDS